MSSKNSLSTLLNDLLRLQADSYSIMTKVSEIVSSSSETVTVDLFDSNGGIKKVTIPSFGSLMDQMKRLENNIEALSGVGSRSSSVQLSDGKFRRLLTTSLKKEAEDIRTMSVPTQFNKKENWFFESFLNPLLYVKFDLTGQVKPSTESVQVSRFILNLDSERKRRVFEESFKGSSEIQYQRFVEIIRDEEISYFLDEETVTVPPRTVRYYGKFTVTDLYDSTVTVENDGEQTQRRALTAKLDSLSYNDRDSEFTGTQSLKVGDSLVVNSDSKDTRFEIVSIDSSKRTVGLVSVEGFDVVKIGVDSLVYYDENEEDVSLDVGVGFNENCVIFLRPVDPDSKIASVNWSPGVGFSTNDLVIDDGTGVQQTLSQFYQNSVVDFGAYLYSMAKEKVPPSVFGIVPDAPAIVAEDFKVVQVNEHMTTNSSVEEIKRLQVEKTRLQSSISSYDKSISDLRSKVETTNYSSRKLEDTDRAELSRLMKDRESAAGLFASTVDSINRLATSESVSELSPKYRVRGFFPIPDAKPSDRTAPQEVVQFVIQHRYLRKDGSSNQPEQITFKDSSGEERRGTFSTWVETRTPVRRRVVDPDTGQLSWSTEDVEDGDSVNVNQVDIPISPNEAVEIRIKSLSEAGWPVSPKESPWSEVVRVDFPADLESIQDVSSITDEAKADRLRVEIRNELDNLGVVSHVSSSFTQGSVTFAHSTREIASGFTTSEQVAISLYDKLVEMQTTMQSLKALIEKAKGKLVVKVVNDIGEEFTAEPNQTLKIFAGNYRDEVASLPVKKGVIVTKTYFLTVYNEAASDLELYAREFGSRYFRVTPSYSSGEGYDSSDVDYNKMRRYDYVPIGLGSPPPSEVSTYGFVREYPEQSSQVLGQFVGFRYKSIDGKRSLYSDVDGTNYGVFNTESITQGAAQFAGTQTEDFEHVALSSTLNAFASSSSLGSTSAGDFIWKGGTSSSGVIPYTDPLVQSALQSSILLHVNHPLVSAWSSMSSVDSVVNDAVQDEVRNSMFAVLQQGSTGWDRQTALFYEGTGSTGDKYSKVGFVDTDQYLIGPLSVGAYLFPSPKSHDDITVPGADSLSFKKVKFGTRDGLTVPIVFQYRMTDYFGSGDQGLGNVAGDPSAGPDKNLTYSKTIGIDIYSNPIDRERFSFDLEISARYYSRSLVSKDTPLRTFENAFDDLAKIGYGQAPSRDVR